MGETLHIVNEVQSVTHIIDQAIVNPTRATSDINSDDTEDCSSLAATLHSMEAINGRTIDGNHKCANSSAIMQTHGSAF